LSGSYRQGPAPSRTEREASLLAVLGLGPGSDEEEVRIAYRRLVKRWHPDSSGSLGSVRQFERITRAYKILRASAHDLPGMAGGRAAKYRRVVEAGEDLFALGQILAGDPDAGAREAAVRRLGLSGRTAAYVFLRRALYDGDPKVAGAAVRAVALLGARQAEGEVAALYSRAIPELKRLILDTAAATGDPLFLSSLVAASADVEPSLAECARKLLAAMDKERKTSESSP
jgi:curved DNA-binding protein CbpA